MSCGIKRFIRNSGAEFLIFAGQSGEQRIEARHEDETVWQKLMADVGAQIAESIAILPYAERRKIGDQFT